MKLRPYQLKSCNSVIAKLKTDSRVVLVAPTGAGKTVMASHIAKKASEKGIEVVAVSHRREINEQIERTVGCRTVSIQKLVSANNVEITTGKLLLIVDECHHYKAPEWSAVFDYFPDAMALGLTATPGEGLGNYFNALVTAAHYPSLVRDGYLSPVRILRPPRRIGPDLWRDPVKAYLETCKDERAFLFAPTVEQAIWHASRFCEEGVRAVAVSGKTPKEERRQHLEWFRNQGIDVICGVQVLTEGVDVPEASCCILAGNSSSLQSYLQKTGRVLRPHSTKTWATLLDLVGDSWIYGSPIEQRDYSLVSGVSRLGIDGVRDCPQCGWAGEYRSTCPQCGWDFASNKGRKREALIFNKELQEVWAGKATPKEARDKEWTRLRCQAKANGGRYGMYWCAHRYKKVFGIERDGLTDDEKLEIYSDCLDRLPTGHKLGAAAYKYKAVVGSWPKQRWVKAAEEARGQSGLFD